MLLAVECAALSNNQNADWPHGTIGVASFGSCVAGFSGTPQRNCLPSGQWDSTIIDPCEVYLDFWQWPYESRDFWY